MKRKQYILWLMIAIVGVALSSILLGVEAGKHESVKDRNFSIQPFPQGDPVRLDGEWEFYWKALYSPNDFRGNTVQTEPHTIEVPQSWGEGENLGFLKTGYGTYLLQIELPKDEVDTTKALYIPSVASAYSLWIDGEKLAANGRVGKSRESMEPESVPKIVQFQVRSQSVQLIIQASNFNQRKGGIYDSILIGEPEVISEYRDKRLLLRTMTVTSLFIMGLYHIALYAFRKHESSLIFFGGLCLFVAIRAVLLEEGLSSYIFDPFLDWELARKLEYLGATLGILFLSLFTYTQFSEDMKRNVRNMVVGVMTAYSLFIIVTPAIVYTRTMVFLQVLIILTFVYLLYVYIMAYIRKRQGALLNAIAILFLFGTAVNDTLYFNNLINTTEMTSIGLLCFLFTQSIIISKRYSMAYDRSERLTQDLFRLNNSLEQQVQIRTMELQESNKQLQVANEKLKEAHLSRSRLISNISHEIGNPLTSIIAYTKGMVDGVVKSEKKYIQLVYEKGMYLSEMLQDLRAMTDMENKQIKYDMKEVVIQDFCYNQYDKFKVDLDEKGITFFYNDFLSAEGEKIKVYMDPVRIEQVIVNLVSNAQRYVSDDGGIISLELDKRNEEHIIIKVKDNGTGINEDELDKVFGRFYKGRRTGKEHHGSGLGLAISKEIIEYHKGSIGVERINEETCFYFILPMVKN